MVGLVVGTRSTLFIDSQGELFPEGYCAVTIGMTELGTSDGVSKTEGASLKLGVVRVHEFKEDMASPGRLHG